MCYLVHGRDYVSCLDDTLQQLKGKIAHADTPNERTSHELDKELEAHTILRDVP